MYANTKSNERQNVIGVLPHHARITRDTYAQAWLSSQGDVWAFLFYTVSEEKIPFSLWSPSCLVVRSLVYPMIGTSRWCFWYTPAILVSQEITTITVPLIEGDWVTVTHNYFFKLGCSNHPHHLFKLSTGPLRDTSGWMAIAAAEQKFWTNPRSIVAVVVAFLKKTSSALIHLNLE